MGGRIAVFIASSLDGFIAGPDDDLSWLPTGQGGEDYGYRAFFAQVGALLMGRNTYEIAAGFAGPWPYEDRPVLVATRRPLDPAAPTVRAVAGEVSALVEQARAAAGDRDVYIDGGNLIRQALDAGLVDVITLTIVPVVLGAGAPLFAGLSQRHPLTLVEHRAWPDGMVQLVYAPGVG